MSGLPADNWYALQTVSGREEKLRESIRKVDPQTEIFIPVRELMIRRQGRESMQRKPLFPGYIFIRQGAPITLNQANEFRLKVNEISGRSSLLLKILSSLRQPGGAEELLLPIGNSEMEFIISMTNRDGQIGFSRFIREGQNVTIVEGALKGKEFIVKKVNPRKKRITIEINLLGRTHLLDVGGEQILPIGQS